MGVQHILTATYNQRIEGCILAMHFRCEFGERLEGNWMANENSLFTPLWNRAAMRRQDENSTSECLVLLLRLILRFDAKLFSEIINFLFSGHGEEPLEFHHGANVQTQVFHKSQHAECAYTDVEITSPELHGIIEVKIGLCPTRAQLLKYLDYLERLQHEHASAHKRSSKRFKLALLTIKTLEALKDDALSGVVQTRWRGLGIWLEDRSVRIEEPVIRHLVEDFVLFLRERGMVPRKVEASLAGGVTALENLLGMIEIALEELKLRVRGQKGTDQGWHFMGFAIDLKSKKNACWVGVYFGDPNVLRFMTERGTKIDAKRAAKLGGNVIQGKWVIDKKLGNQFFNLTPNEQTMEVRNFIEDSRNRALKLAL